MPTRTMLEQDERAFLAQRAGIFYPRGHVVMMFDDLNEALVCHQALRLEGRSPADLLLVEPPQARGFLGEIARARPQSPAPSTRTTRETALRIASAIADRLLAFANAGMGMIIVRESASPRQPSLATRLRQHFRLRFAARYDATIPFIEIPFVETPPAPRAAPRRYLPLEGG
ncbi:MAG: hypothetical protein AB7P21_09410 [Lautropia sp.]